MAEVTGELSRLDHAVYDAVAVTETPRLDAVMRIVSRAADHSKLSMAAAVGLAVTGGGAGRRAAVSGLASIAVTSAFANLAVKPVARRRRPDRAGAAVPARRHVPMPTSRSFPSGHAAAAHAFAVGASRFAPAAGAPLYALAAVVSYSRVHTGVHYPGDVIAGALVGLTLGSLTANALDRSL
ncbi:MAG TPA: phosphatase PAP2 family protein [Solirubrobacteraceae bacterium]|nr:phosphatase PAP2 family protein [Solirubrobacteraceae bacterium]